MNDPKDTNLLYTSNECFIFALYIFCQNEVHLNIYCSFKNYVFTFI